MVAEDAAEHQPGVDPAGADWLTAGEVGLADARADAPANDQSEPPAARQA
jgi:hypothetical protein